jgi:16S rRNA (uracil1498-N3)-methyltransferase
MDRRAGRSGARARFVLSLAEGTRGIAAAVRHTPPATATCCVLSGPEGGLSATEEQEAIARGFAPVTLGARVLRAETAALAALVSLGGA